MKIYSFSGITFLTLIFPQIYENDVTSWHLESFVRFPGSKAHLPVTPLRRKKKEHALH